MSSRTASARSRLFALAKGWIPRGLQNHLGRWRWLRPLRDALIRPDGVDTVAAGPVDFDGLSFSFEAPFHVYHQARTRGIETLLSRYAKAWIQEGWTCVDVGSQYGFLTLIMALSTGPSGRVVACEGRARTATVLRRNLEANGVESIARVAEGWIGATDEPIDGPGRRMRLDSLLDGLGVERVDLLKIDVDGGDLDVLRGAAAVLRRDRPIVIVELAANERAIYDLLRALGYDHLLGMRLEPVDPDAAGFAGWPPNLIASTAPLAGPAPRIPASWQC